MTRADLVNEVKILCQEHQLQFVDDVLVGNSVLILVRGEESKRILGLFLKEQGLEHTTPTMITDSIGSYVTIS